MSANRVKGTTRRGLTAAAALPLSPTAGVLSVSAGLLITLFAGWWHAIRYLRMGAPKHSPWPAPRDDLNDSSYQCTVLDFSIFQPQEVALVGELGEADTQTLINTVYTAYLPNKVVAGCAPDDEEDAGLIPILVDRPTRDGKPTAYVCECYVC